MRYVFVTGGSFSGSTLLAFLLNAHPRLSSISEMGPFPPTVDVERYRCSCGRLLLECPFYLALQRRMIALGHPFDLHDWELHFQVSRRRLLDILLARPLRSVPLEVIRDRFVGLWPGYHAAISRISARVVDFASSVLEITGKDCFVDVQKDAVRVKFLRAIPALDLRVIHLVRDVRGATASFMKHESCDARVGVRRWIVYNMNSERARRFVSLDRWMRVLYDDLCAAPQATLDRIADFIGIERTTLTANFYDTDHHIVGNRMRLRRESGGVVAADTAWKTQLTESDLDLIARVGGRTNRFFGFDWP